MKKIPYGISDYKQLAEEGYYYVDKTMYLSKLEDATHIALYLRPRRFGKTLFTSMMYYYYDINSAYLFDSLYKDTHIYNNPTSGKNNYYVLKFDFSGMSSNKNDVKVIEEKFKTKVIADIKSFLDYYGLFYEMDTNLSTADIILNFFVYFKSLKLENKIYIIIDEYDNFTNSILSKDVNLFKKILSGDGFVKDFYARIKEYSGIIIDRVFITGVCSISLNSMTSGFNVATNITTDPRFNSMTALTHNEIKELIKEYDDKDKIFNEMLENYDGYNFNRMNVELVFNPSLTMYYLNHYNNFNIPPMDLLDSNIISNYDQIKNILSLGDYRDIIEDIFNNGEIKSSLVTNFDLNGDTQYKFDRSDIVSLLFYFGYLTIKEPSMINYVFRIPNRVINTLYSKYYLSLLKDYNIVTIDEREIDAINEIINYGKIDKLCEYISYLLRQADNRIYNNFREKDLQLLMYSILNKYLNIKSFVEHKSNDNFMDLLIYGKEHNILIELKYLSKKEKGLYKKRYKEALEQINKYIEDESIDKSKLNKYIVIYTMSDYVLTEV